MEVENPSMTIPTIDLAVHSEVGRLRTVMVHRPGAEIDRMAPSLMEEFLFDDILYGDRARFEHDQFRQVLEYVVDEVLDIEEVLGESLDDAEVRRAFVDALARLEHLSADNVEQLAALDGPGLAAVALRGLEHPLEVIEHHRSRRVPYVLRPLPNMLFMRDPLVVMADGACLGSMARKVRQREPLIMRFAYGYHPRLSLLERQLFYFDELALLSMRRHMDMPSLEGGDILVLSDRVLAIGASERTSEVAVDLLAEALTRRTSIETILMVMLPKRRAYMHLDTVFTQISAHECLVYPPMFMPDGAELLPTIRKELRGDSIHSELKPSLLEALAEDGLDLQPISCGGAGDRIAQQREQWTDGANALALAPGVITLYERNIHTADELLRHGYDVVAAEEIIGCQTKLVLDGSHKYAILINGTELSRARGGPRCMTMPLRRDRL